MRAAVAAFALLITACAAPAKDSTKVTAADAVAGAVQTFDHFESPTGKFGVDLPSVWKGSYSAVERNDTTAGARFALEFVFKPDAAWKAEPHTLLVVRIFPKATWAKIVAQPGAPIAAKAAEKGDDVFAYSLPAANPYPPGTPQALRFDDMILAVVNDAAGLRVTPR